MSLARFKSSNHPQQTAKRERGEALFEVDEARDVTDDVDDRGTDQVFFDATAARFGGFTLDVAAAAHNAKCPDYYDIEDDGLTQEWCSPRVWCNPPYSDCGSWVRKAWAEWRREPFRRVDVIVMLLPANRVEQGWWQDLVEPYRDRPGSPLRVEFLRGRMRFDRPDWTPGPKGDRPPFGCCLLIWRNYPKSRNPLGWSPK